MIPLQDLSIQELFFLVLRLTAATGGFIVGYLIAGPIARFLFRIAFHREMPNWSAGLAKIVGGLVVAVLVFLGLPLGFGGGGLGTGGGTGAGKGPGKGEGTAKSSGSAADLGPGKGDVVSEKTTAGTGTLVIEMLGPKTADGDKCYRIQRKGMPTNFAELEDYWNKTRPQWSRVEIVLTPTSASENDPAVDRLRKLVKNSDDNRPRTFVIVDEIAK
jgi:hypothetical protein